MKKVCIVVPVYKPNLNLFEKISLQQLLRILGNYPICFVHPDTMEIKYEELDGYEYNICKFDKWYFQCTETYSELVLSPFFYEQFLDYKYILIYQLDSFVFFDKLSDFCDMDYDYIGAVQYHSWTKDAVVGNGGLSLRKVESALNVTGNYKTIVKDPYYRDYFKKWEDNFFSYCGGKREIEFTVPEIPLANTFSVVMDIEHGIQNIPVNGLPFGTHAWHRMNFDFWKDIIKIYGYQTDNLVAKNNRNTLERDQNARYREYFLDKISQFSNNVKREILEELDIPLDEEYAIWGAGVFGKRFLRVFTDLKLKVSVIFDSKPKDKEIYGITVKYPDFGEIRQQNLTVLIGSEIYEEEIEGELIKNKCEKFIRLPSIFNEKWKVFRIKYYKLFPKIEGVTIPFGFVSNKEWISDIAYRLEKGEPQNEVIIMGD